MKTSLKEIREFANLNRVVNITYLPGNELEDIRKKESYFLEIAYSVGKYGVTGKLLIGETTNTLYAITSRTNALYIIH